MISELSATLLAVVTTRTSETGLSQREYGDVHALPVHVPSEGKAERSDNDTNQAG